MTFSTIPNALKKPWDSPFLVPFSLIIMVWVLGNYYASFPFDPRQSGFDASQYYYIGMMIGEGLRPYIDVWDHKGIVLYLLNYLGSIVGLGNLELVEAAAIVYLSYKLCVSYFTDRRRALVPVLLLLPVLGMTIDGGNMTESHSLPFMLASLYLYLKILNGSDRVRTYSLLCACMFVLVFMMRANNTGVWVAFGSFCVADLLFRKQYARLGNIVAYSLAGMLIPAIALYAYLVHMNILSESLFSAFTFNLKYTAAPTDGKASFILAYVKQSLLYAIPLTLPAIVLALHTFSTSLRIATQTGNAPARIARFIRSHEMGVTMVALLMTAVAVHKSILGALAVQVALVCYLWLPKNRQTLFTVYLWVISALLMIISGRRYPHYAATMYPAALLILCEVLRYFEQTPKLIRYIKYLAASSLFIFVLNQPTLFPAGFSMQQHYDVMNAYCTEDICTIAAPLTPHILTKRFRPSPSPLYYGSTETSPELKARYFSEMEANLPMFIFLPKDLRPVLEKDFLDTMRQKGLMQRYTQVNDVIYVRNDLMK